MPYRTDLKRPDLKGQFPCSVCHKIFCHSSSLSRHRMQAHYKCYICTQCNQEIHSSETLRSHMYRCHQIQRMFMCRCCNWAFPDKTSLHIHMQSMQKSGKPGDVSVLARSSLEKSEIAEAGRAHSFGSPSNSSPDDFRGDSISPSISEMEEQQDDSIFQEDIPQHQIKTEEGAHQIHSIQPSLPQHVNTAGIFPNQIEASSAEFLSKFRIKTESMDENERQLHVANMAQQQQQTLMSQSASISPAMFHQQWFNQLLVNNPYFSPAEPKGNGQQQQQTPNNNTKVIQSFCAALASAAASRATQNSTGPVSSRQNIPQGGIPTSTQSPPKKKQKRNEKKNDGDIPPLTGDLSLQIPQHQRTTFPMISPAVSEGSTAGKLNSLITNLLSIRGSDQNSLAEDDGKSALNAMMPERKNKRKMRTPTRAEMTEIIYGGKAEEQMLEQSADITFPCIQRFMEKTRPECAIHQNADQQPSPAVSDSQTSGSSNGHLEAGGLSSPKKCDSCQANISEVHGIIVSRKLRESVKQINQIAERVSHLAHSVQEMGTKEELLACSRQLKAIAMSH